MYYICKNLKHLWDFFKYILERIVCVGLIIVGIYFLFTRIINVSDIQNTDNVESQQIIFNKLSFDNWGIVITVIGLIITAIWSIYQYTKNQALQQQQKGAEIAKLFSEDLLYKCTILGNVILHSKLNDIIKHDSINEKNFKNFDKTEAFDLYESDSLFVDLKKVLFSADIQQAYLRELDSRISLKEIPDTKTYSYTKAKNLFILNNQNLPFKFTLLISSVLNDLEYICMYISSQSADSRYIYQSLHQIFLMTIKILYPIICMNNNDYTNKYYTNIIYVYNQWQKQRSSDERKEKIRKTIARWFLNPKIKTV